MTSIEFITAIKERAEYTVEEIKCELCKHYKGTTLKDVCTAFPTIEFSINPAKGRCNQFKNKSQE